MKSITIKGQERESVGKKATKALRDAGMVPCVIYGGKQPVHFAAEEKAFKSDDFFHEFLLKEQCTKVTLFVPN